MGKSVWRRPELREALAYCVPLGLPLSRFLSWDEDDQDAALAYMREQAKVCTCGTRPEEWADGDPYEVKFQHCRGCELLELAQSDESRPKRKGERAYLGIPDDDEDGEG